LVINKASEKELIGEYRIYNTFKSNTSEKELIGEYRIYNTFKSNIGYYYFEVLIINEINQFLCWFGVRNVSSKALAW
jgi:hypothetical protein